MPSAQFIAICDVVPGDTVTVRIRGKNETSGTTTLLAAVLQEDVFREGYEKLSRSTYTVTSFENTRVEGTIDCDRAGLMYTSIPQDGNWSVTVDGEPAEITLIGNAMIGVKLTQGSHEVVFDYHNKAFSLGWKVSLVFLAVFALLVWKVYPPANKLISRKGKYQR